ncbi:MAG: L-glutamate gamma-semialdehyde dehydrogenase [Armatimonadetes bacterium]|nr:L-glutamate gamma-semialdehyde dehydrogenase [Armatimonadota bacterium]
MHSIESPLPPFQNVTERDYSKPELVELMEKALVKVKAEFNTFYPLFIDGKDVITAKEITSTNPARPTEVVGRVGCAGKAEAEMAIIAANKALPGWRATAPEKRAEYLMKAADLAEQDRDELSALMVYEVGKNWREADIDVCEGIDFLRFYAQEMIRLGTPTRLGHAAGETNYHFYESKGVAVIISPWNFPWAITLGMAVGAIVTGNTVLLKPATQSPIIAAKFVEIMQRAGLPAGVLNFIPGPGSEIGDYIVEHPNIHMIGFTGSKEIGCRIYRLAANVNPGQAHLKKVISEMGGKNGMIVDKEADIDLAAQSATISAFGFQGQKCSAGSRVIVLEDVYDEFVEKMVACAEKLTIGFTEDLNIYNGPVIDKNAYKSIKNYIEIGKKEGRCVFERDVTHLGDGFFISPTIIADIKPDAVIANEEIFGPVVAIIKVKDIDEAIEVANGTDYALTGGIISNNKETVERVIREFRVGNLYVNRKITGAVVSRQPFGGFKLSGVGSKAGGYDYLNQFMDPRSVCVNENA